MAANNPIEHQPTNGRARYNHLATQPPGTTKAQQQQHHLQRMKSKFTFTTFIYMSGIFLVFSKIQSRCKARLPASANAATASFRVDELPPIILPPNNNSNIINPMIDDESSSSSIQQQKSTSRIPHIIHQSYKSFSTLPPHWADGPTAWQTLHPHYTYKFWSDADNRLLIQQHYAWFLSTYDAYPTPIQRADAARYFAILHYGGIYADMDIVPIRNVESLLNILDHPQHANKEMIVAETYNLGLTNALFAAIPNSTILSQFVQELPCHTRPLHGLEWLVPHFAVLLSTGPTRLWIYLNQYRSRIVTIPPVLWGQCHQCLQQSAVCIPQLGSFFETRKGGSWHKWDTRIMNFIFCHVQFCMWGVVCALSWMYVKWCRLRQNSCNYCCRRMHTGCEGGASANGVVVGEDSLPQHNDDVVKKRKKWWTTSTSMIACTFDNIFIRIRVLLAQHRLPIFCGVIFILVF